MLNVVYSRISVIFAKTCNALDMKDIQLDHVYNLNMKCFMLRQFVTAGLSSHTLFLYTVNTDPVIQ